MNLNRLLQKRIIFYTAALIIAGLTILFAAFIHSPAAGSYLTEAKWNLSYRERTVGTYSLPIYKTGASPSQFDTGIYTLASEFSIPDKLEVPLLVLPEVHANAFSVSIDGRLVGRIGDMRNGRTNRWNTPHTFILPEALEAGTHSIEIRGYGLYEIGISSSPYFLDGNSYSLKFLFLYFFNNIAVALIIGALVIVVLIFLITARTIVTENKHRFFLAVGLLGLAVYLFDYLYIPYLPFEYYVFKKIPMAGLYVAIFFSIPGFFSYHNHGLSLSAKLVMLLPALSFFAIILFPQNIFQVREVYKYANLSLFPYIILMHASLMHRRETDDRSRLIVFGLTFMTILALRDVVMILLGQGIRILSHLGIAIFLLTITFAFIREMAEYYTQLVKMEKWAEAVYQESMHDPLTGALNRKAFDVLKKLRPERFAIIILDLDDFKTINDTHGHQAGDQVLTTVADTIIQNIRKSDYLVRLGGDEFAVILFGCELGTARSSAENLLRRIKNLIIDYEGHELRISCSMGVGTVPTAANVDDRMVEIDQYMYKAKRAGKGRVAVES
ncbi:MAG: GGDEF domain-containing protein [Spirochaetia bacterium]